MGELVKIREMSLKYDIAARALKYYEDMGLISSTRSDDYAYRMYDDAAVKRLEQILILRKLNIGIKDIQRIFNTYGSEVVLEVLGKKVENIDEEVSLLHELKEIVIEFIQQIEKADFSKESDVKLLYDKAKEIESQFVNAELKGNSANVNRLLEVTEKLEKMPDIRIIRLRKAQIARSTDFKSFDNWLNGLDMSQQPYHQEYMWFNRELNANEWFYILPKWLTDTNGFEISEFPGGLYAVASAVGWGDDLGRIYRLVHKWVRESEVYKLDKDENESDTLVHVTGDEYIAENGKSDIQVDLYVPIAIKKH